MFSFLKKLENVLKHRKDKIEKRLWFYKKNFDDILN